MKQTSDPLGLGKYLSAMRTRRYEPLPPLLVPTWFPTLWAAHHPNDDLDAVCRRYGFDGYVTGDQPDVSDHPGSV